MNRRFAYALIVAVLLVPFAAQAQLVGVLPDVGFTAFVNWMTGPLGRPVITLAFIVSGLVMMVGRHTFEGIVFCLLGATFYAGAGGLANLITGGAGG